MTSRALRTVALATSVALPFVILGLILVLGINLPYLDEWEWTDLIYHAHLGTLSFAELWRPHNEHRIFVCDIVMLGLSRLGGWDVVREQCFSLGMFVASQIVLWRLIERTVVPRFTAVAFLSVSALLYSIGQVENFANGFQLGWAICTFALVTSAVLLTSSKRGWKHVALAGILATLASFSSSQGLLIWLVGVLWLAFAPPVSMRAIAVWIIWGACAVVVDRIGFTSTAWHASWSDLPGVVGYSLVYLGSPLSGWGGVTAAGVVGAITVAAVAVAASIDARRRGHGLAARLPWYGLAAYAVLAAPATAFARLDLGIGQALSPRYITVSTMLAMTLVVLLVHVAAALRNRTLQAAIWLTIACITLTVIPASVNGVRYWVWYTGQRQRDVAAIKRGDAAALGDLYPSAPELARFLGELRQMREGLFRP